MSLFVRLVPSHRLAKENTGGRFTVGLGLSVDICKHDNLVRF